MSHLKPLSSRTAFQNALPSSCRSYSQCVSVSFNPFKGRSSLKLSWVLNFFFFFIWDPSCCNHLNRFGFKTSQSEYLYARVYTSVSSHFQVCMDETFPLLLYILKMMLPPIPTPTTWINPVALAFPPAHLWYPAFLLNPLPRSMFEFLRPLNDLFPDGEASQDWPSAMHDHMSIPFNISPRARDRGSAVQALCFIFTKRFYCFTEELQIHFRVPRQSWPSCRSNVAVSSGESAGSGFPTAWHVSLDTGGTLRPPCPAHHFVLNALSLMPLQQRLRVPLHVPICILW